jgi:hypothetical protein
LRVEYQRYVNAPRNSAANFPENGVSATSPDDRGRWSSGDSDSPPVALRRTWREYGHAARTRRNFRQVANDPTFQEVDWHRVWKGEFGMPTTKVKKSKSK